MNFDYSFLGAQKYSKELELQFIVVVNDLTYFCMLA